MSMSSDPFARITLTGPGANLLDPGRMAAIGQQLRTADADPAVSGIELTGAGEVFCGGLDIAAIRAGADPVSFASALVDLLRVFPRLTKPVVARVNGDAIASGASLVAVCDYAVAIATARIGTAEVSNGIWPMVAQVPLIQRLGVRAAMENVGSGEPFTANRAREVGLINQVVEPDELDRAVETWLGWAARGGTATAVGRSTFYELANLSYDDALDHALSRFAGMFTDGRS